MVDRMPHILGLELSTSVVRAIMIGPSGPSGPGVAEAEDPDGGPERAGDHGHEGADGMPRRVIEAFAQLEVDDYEPPPGAPGRPLGMGDRIIESLDLVLGALPNARGMPTALAYVPAIGARYLNRASRHVEGLGIGPILEIESQRAERVGRAAFANGTLEVPGELLDLHEGLDAQQLAVVAGAALGLRGEGADPIAVEVPSGSSPASDPFASGAASGAGVALAGAGGLLGAGKVDASTPADESAASRVEDGEVEDVQSEDDGAGKEEDEGPGAAEIEADPSGHELPARDDKYEMFRPGEGDIWDEDRPTGRSRGRTTNLPLLIGAALIIGGLVLLWTQWRPGRSSVGQVATPTTAAQEVQVEPVLEAVDASGTATAEGNSGTQSQAATNQPEPVEGGQASAEGDEGGEVEAGTDPADRDDLSGEDKPEPATTEPEPADSDSAGSEPAGPTGAEAGSRRAIVDWPNIGLVGAVASVEDAEAQFKLASEWFDSATVVDETIIAVDAPSVDNFQMLASIDTLFVPESNVLDSANLDMLEALVKAMGVSEGTVLSVGVYGPEDPELAASRAAAIANYLVGRGISQARVLRLGYGDRQPPEGSATELVELTILGVLSD